MRYSRTLISTRFLSSLDPAKKHIWDSQKIIHGANKSNEESPSELKTSPEYFTSFIPKVLQDALQKDEREKSRFQSEFEQVFH